MLELNALIETLRVANDQLNAKLAERDKTIQFLADEVKALQSVVTLYEDVIEDLRMRIKY